LAAIVTFVKELRLTAVKLIERANGEPGSAATTRDDAAFIPRQGWKSAS
jgi:hypothetical protein